MQDEGNKDAVDYDDRTKMAGLDVISSIGLIVFGAAVFIAAANMKVYRSLVVSPGLFPMILGGMFIFLGMIMGILALRRNGFRAAGYMLSAGHISACLKSPRFLRGTIVFLAILVYVLLFGKIHFVPLTALYLFFSFMYLKAMKLPATVLVSVAAALCIWAVFKYVFGIPIP